MRKTIIPLLVFILLFTGCSSNSKNGVEESIKDAFRVRAEAVYKYQDKKHLANYFSAQALQQSAEYLNWSPHGQWNNVKDLSYSTTLRIEDLKVDGKQATATVLDTAVISWDYIDPTDVPGTAAGKEDAWTNRKHLVTLLLSAEGKWIVDQDIINK